jgi:hypothetical protein
VKANFRTIDVRGEHDAVVTDADFLDLGHAVGSAKINVGLLDARGRVGNVDGVFANTFAKLLAACARTAGFNNRGRKLEVFTEGFGDDRGVRQNGGGASDLDLVAGNSSTGESRRSQDCGCGEFDCVHGNLPSWVRVARPFCRAMVSAI